jgi:hypothetical protein
VRTLITLGATVVIAGLIGMGAAFGIGSAAKDSTTVSSTSASASAGSGSGQALFPSLSGSSDVSAAYGSR